MEHEPRIRPLKGGKFMRYELLDFYPESLEKAVEKVRYELRLPIYLVRRRGRWLVKVWRLPWPRTVLVVEGQIVEVRGREGAEVLDEYCRRVRRQEPIRRLVRDLLFVQMMEREFGGRREFDSETKGGREP